MTFVMVVSGSFSDCNCSHGVWAKAIDPATASKMRARFINKSPLAPFSNSNEKLPHVAGLCQDRKNASDKTNPSSIYCERAVRFQFRSYDREARTLGGQRFKWL